MASIQVKFGCDTYTLTDEHARANYKQPVLIGPDGKAYGPWEIAYQGPDLEPNFAGEVGGGTQWLARSIASFIRDDSPDDLAGLDLLRRFEAIPGTAW